MPKISIIIPTFNHAAYLGQCLDSVLAQDFTDWSAVIVDDASTDGADAIIVRYTERDRRFKSIRHETNYGPAKLSLTHNEALSSDDSEYVTVLEGDDYWPTARLTELNASLDTNDAVLAHGDAYTFEKGKTAYFSHAFAPAVKNNLPLGAALEYFFKCANPVIAQSAMARRKALENIGGFAQIPSLFMVDYPTWFKLAFTGRFNYIPKPLGYWRRHAQAMTVNYREKLLTGSIDFARGLYAEKRNAITSLNLDGVISGSDIGYLAEKALCRHFMENGELGKAGEAFARLSGAGAGAKKPFGDKAKEYALMIEIFIRSLFV